MHFLSGMSLLTISSRGNFALQNVVPATSVASQGSKKVKSIFSIECAKAEVLPPAIGPTFASSRAGDRAAVYCLRNVDRHTHQLFTMTAMTAEEALEAYI